MIMATDIKIVEEARKPLSMHPKKFALWLFIVSVGMLFAAWTSAYIVKRGEPGWSSFELPSLFWINTGIVLLSSVTMIWAQRSAKNDNMEMTKVGISITALLGVAFLVGQFMGWQQMTEMGYYFTGMGSNTSSSFIYVLSGFHGLHIVGGLVFLMIVMIRTFMLKVNSKNMVSIEMCAVYWHFLSLLWLYLFVFLILNR
jgi:cytochrome c oxidase subunit III